MRTVTAAIAVFVTAGMTAAFGADLTCKVTNLPSLVTTSGATIVVNTSVTNSDAFFAIAGASQLGLYVSSNSTFDGTDVQVGAASVPTLGGGSSDTQSTPVQLPASVTNGSWYMLCRADATSKVPESNESNNTSSKAFAVCYPPGAVSLSSPANGGSIPQGTTTVALSWAAATNATTYDVYFGTTSTPPLYQQNVTGTTVNVPITTGPVYYWRLSPKRPVERRRRHRARTAS